MRSETRPGAPRRAPFSSEDPRDLAADLYAGRHHEILARTVDSRLGFDGARGLPFVVGALVFTGRLFEAEAWAQGFQAQGDDDDQAFTLFFLAIGYTRHSRYADARQAIGRLWTIWRRRPESLAGFFVRQGIGFYRYFSGRYGNVAALATKAAETATLARFQYGKYLALDLLGHAQIDAGDIGSGLAHLRDALSLARQFGDGGSVEALNATLAIREARFGLSTPTALSATRRPGLEDDTYSAASIGLEAARQLLLRGHYAEAERALLDTWILARGSRHRRLELWTRLGFAELCFRRGEGAEGLKHIAGVHDGVDLRMDLPIRIAALALERKLRGDLAPNPLNADLQRQLDVATRQNGSVLALRRWQRARGQRPVPHLAPEDRIGGILDLAMDPALPLAERMRLLNEYGLLGLMPHVLGIPAGRDTLLVDIVPETLIFLGRDGCHRAPVGPSAQVRALLEALCAGQTSREAIVARVWGYNYNRLRHDGILYQLVVRVRRLLGAFGNRLITTPLGYELHCALLTGPLAPVAPVTTVEVGRLDEAEARGLNGRQRRLLGLARELGRLDAAIGRVRLQVPRASLSRDLKDLTDRGLLVRRGSGKATHYVIPTSP